VWLHYTILSMPRRGGRVILLERLRWETLLLWLLHVVEEVFGVADVTYTERDVEYELSAPGKLGKGGCASGNLSMGPCG
jgi:hypothetical protein